MADTQPASVYDLAHAQEAASLATFAVLVDNEPGVLHRLVGLFAARGYNIESLTVAETDRSAHTSSVTIVTRGTPQVLTQNEAQLTKMVSTPHVQDVKIGRAACRERGGTYVSIAGVAATLKK